MDSTTKELKEDDPNTNMSEQKQDRNVDENLHKSKQDKRKAMAKRGLKSLALMLTVPTLLTLASTCFFHHSYVNLAKPSSILHPPLWALHLTALSVSFLMGFSSWIVWADGGFHKSPRAFQIYATWLLLSVVWYPMVVGMGLSRVGLVVGLGMVGAIFGCFRVFKTLNPAAGNLVVPCLVLGGYLAVVNLKLVFT